MCCKVWRCVVCVVHYRWFNVRDQNLKTLCCLFILNKKRAHWKCLVKHQESNRNQSLITEFFLQVCMINLPGHTVERLCTFVFRLLPTVLSIKLNQTHWTWNTTMNHGLKFVSAPLLPFCYGNQVGFYLCVQQCPAEGGKEVMREENENNNQRKEQ